MAGAVARKGWVVCEECGAVVRRRGPRQLYCEACATARSRASQSARSRRYEERKRVGLVAAPGAADRVRFGREWFPNDTDLKEQRACVRVLWLESREVLSAEEGAELARLVQWLERGEKDDG